jgi:hypothetical protein
LREQIWKEHCGDYEPRVVDLWLKESSTEDNLIYGTTLEHPLSSIRPAKLAVLDSNTMISFSMRMRMRMRMSMSMRMMMKTKVFKRLKPPLMRMMMRTKVFKRLKPPQSHGSTSVGIRISSYLFPLIMMLGKWSGGERLSCYSINCSLLFYLDMPTRMKPWDWKTL